MAVRKTATRSSGPKQAPDDTRPDDQKDASATVSVTSGPNSETITTTRPAGSPAGGGSGGGSGGGGSGGSGGTGTGGGDQPPPDDGLGIAAQAVAAANVLAVGESPAMAMSMIYQAMAGAAAQRMENATLQQATANTILQTATLKGIELLLDAGRATTTEATTVLAGTAGSPVGGSVDALAKAIVDRLAQATA